MGGEARETKSASITKINYFDSPDTQILSDDTPPTSYLCEGAIGRVVYMTGMYICLK